MWSPDRHRPSRRRFGLALLPVLLLLGACGFQPLYGNRTGNRVVADLAAVQISQINDRTGQQLRNYLVDRMQPGQGGTPSRYRLDVTLDENRSDLGVRRDTLSTYSQLQLVASVRLLDLQTGKILLATGTRSYTSYVTADGGFPVLVGEADARARAVDGIGDDIVARLSLFMRQQREPAAP